MRLTAMYCKTPEEVIEFVNNSSFDIVSITWATNLFVIFFYEKELQDRDIVEAISDFIHLEKRGKNYIGLCPFHEEKTPSFNVSRERQMFHCFGCGEGGDLAYFISKMERRLYYE